MKTRFKFLAAALLTAIALFGAYTSNETVPAATPSKPVGSPEHDAANDAIVAEASPLAQVKRVMIVSFDGLRPDAISRERTPVLASLIDAGSYHAASLAEIPAATLPNHTTMLTGLSVIHHGVWFNIDQNGRINQETIFDVARAAGVSAGFFASKMKFSFLCAEQDADARFIGKMDDATNAAIEAIRDRDLRLIFMHFSEPDSSGHAEGWMTEPYLAGAGRSDAALGRILKAMEDKGTRDETVIIVTADHGGHDTMHGFDIPEDRHVPLIIQGPGIAAGRRLCGDVHTMDVAATALSLLGLPTASAKDGRPLTEASTSNEPESCGDDADVPVDALCGATPLLAPLSVMCCLLGVRRRRRAGQAKIRAFS